MSFPSNYLIEGPPCSTVSMGFCETFCVHSTPVAQNGKLHCIGWLVIRASLRFEKWLAFSINPRTTIDIFPGFFRTEVKPYWWYILMCIHPCYYLWWFHGSHGSRHQPINWHRRSQTVTRSPRDWYVISGQFHPSRTELSFFLHGVFSYIIFQRDLVWSPMQRYETSYCFTA